METLAALIVVLGLGATLLIVIFVIFHFVYPKLGTQYTIQVKVIVAASFEHAQQFGITRIEPEFLLYTIVKEEIGVAFVLLKELGFKRDEFVGHIESKVKTKQMPVNVDEILHLGTTAEDCLVEAIRMARINRASWNSAYFLIAIIQSIQLTELKEKYQVPTVDAIADKMTEREYLILLREERTLTLVEKVSNWLNKK